MTASELLTTPFGPRTTAREILDDVSLDGQRFLVTGGASGIGAETARALARAGAEVTIGVRDPARVADIVRDLQPSTGSGRVIAAPLDLADLASVRRFTDDWRGPLNGLVANAGIMALPDLERTPEGWERQLAVNYLGHFAVILGLHDALAAAGTARVAIVSSTAHLRSPFVFDDPQFTHRPYDRWSAYAQSKTADVLLAAGIAHRWAADGITANALMPGWITTNLQRHLDDDTLRSMGAMDAEGNRIDQDHFKTVEQGASTSVLVVASPLLDGVTGRYFEDNKEAEVIVETAGRTSGVAAHALDADAASRLWDEAEAVLRGR